MKNLILPMVTLCIASAAAFSVIHTATADDYIIWDDCSRISPSALESSESFDNPSVHDQTVAAVTPHEAFNIYDDPDDERVAEIKKLAMGRADSYCQYVHHTRALCTDLSYTQQEFPAVLFDSSGKPTLELMAAVRHGTILLFPNYVEWFYFTRVVCADN